MRSDSGPTGSGPLTIATVEGDALHPSNHGRLCTKGATHAQLMATDGRMTTAHIRPARGSEPVPTPLAATTTDAGRRLRQILDTHGPDAIALYVSGQMSLEAQYLANKLAKGYIRTAHIESNSRLCMASAGTGYTQSLGADGPPGSYSDIEQSDLFLVIGANMADCHPILFLRMADRLGSGARLIVVDPRRTATAERADLFLQITSGTDLALLNGLLHLLVESGDIDQEFIAEHTEGWPGMPQFLAAYSPSAVAAVTGLAEDDIRTAARWIGEAREWMTLWTMGLNQSTHGTWNTNAICNLHLATGAICRPGSGPFSLTGQPNAMGGREMGYMGPGLPGQRSVKSAADRAFVEQQWQLTPGSIRAEFGAGTIDMFAQMAAGDIKACWIICTNPVASVPNRQNVIDGLRRAELVITQDAYLTTATNEYADVMLPAALWAESDGVSVNSERTATLTNRAIDAPGDARPDWHLICDIAAAMGFGDAFDYSSSEEIFEEIRAFWNPRTGYDMRGASYARLRQGPVQWPCPPSDSGDSADRHPIRYLNDGVSQDLHVDENGTVPRLAFPTPSRRAAFHARAHRDPAELPGDGYPMILNTGRLQHHWHTLTKTGRIRTLDRLHPSPFVEVHPHDAVTLGIVEGDIVEIASRRGSAELPVIVSENVKRGSCFAPFHWNDTQGPGLTINAVTNDAVDADSLQPEFKVSAVALRPTGRTVVDGASDSQAQALGDIAILWTSQTGNAETAAISVHDLLEAAGISATLTAMDECDPVDLGQVRTALVIASSFGEGGPPDNGARFWSSLAGLSEGTKPLNHMRYAVLGFGDRAYADFCGHAKALDARLQELGAVPVLGRVDGEATNRSLVASWTADLLEAIGEGTAASTETVRRLRSDGLPAAAPEPFTRAAPILAALSHNEILSAPDSDKEVRRIEFDLSGHDVDYSVGDALGIYPTNREDDVRRWLDATGFDGELPITIDGGELPLATALAEHYDICRVTDDLLRFIAERRSDKPTIKLLRGRDSTARERWLQGRNALDVLREFPIRADIDEWQQVLIRLTPRQYSISSSPLVSPRSVALTVSIVRYRGPDGSARGGVGSTFLADRAQRLPVPIFLQRSPHFRPPGTSDTPMIMIGPGTGIAPFRGFLQERRALGHTGRNWLFFGDQHRAQNFYYREELDGFLRDGSLRRLDLAFSRDQDKRIYVQHRMLEQGAQLWQWLSEGAHLYVCGDASRMAKDVDNTLLTIAQKYGRMSGEEALEFRKDLVAEKRYVRDVY
ncbi:bifunctional nitrate reductase/sulfite reductase flavoprotein subunit alpha [Mycobacterium sp. NPDC050853]|uniref:bifunctional nitrate reductase/sulfite reductase flavoprotein subunit alpha n=1 Tax=Mycobacterium sp. NPDC050853 TaxID=3155160 RepID=UPI0033DD0B68